MTKKRASFSKSAAVRYLPFYELCLEKLKAGRHKESVFVEADSFGVTVRTLHNRFRDALKFLVVNNLDEHKDRRAEFEYLSAIIRVQDEPTGIRIIFKAGPPPGIVAQHSSEGAVNPVDWKTELETYLQDPTKKEPKVITNCMFSAENLAWVRKVCEALGAAFFVEGSTITVAKQ